MKHLLLISVLALFTLPVAADEATMNAEIDHILATVSASDCVFIRNGKEHDAEAAVDHLSLKRRRGKKYYDSADEFIENMASSSSWSGKPYKMRCNGEELLAADWFTSVLEEFRAGTAGES